LHPANRHRQTTRPAIVLLLLLLSAALTLPAGGCRRKGGKAFNKGQAHLQKKHYTKAIVSFQKAVKQNPAFGEAYYNLGAARFQLAAVKLNELVKHHGSPTLKAALKATVGKTPAPSGLHPPPQKATLETMVKELRLLPAAQAKPIVTLLRQSLTAKLKARQLFEKGKFVVVAKSSTRRSMLGKLNRLVRMRALLRKKGEQDRGLWLLAVARPSLLTAPTTKKPHRRPVKEMKP